MKNRFERQMWKSTLQQKSVRIINVWVKMQYFCMKKNGECSVWTNLHQNSILDMTIQKHCTRWCKHFGWQFISFVSLLICIKMISLTQQCKNFVECDTKILYVSHFLCKISFVLFSLISLVKTAEQTSANRNSEF